MKVLALLLPAVLLSSAVHAMPVARIAGAPATTLVHGCHGAYQKDGRGWHRHDGKCGPQRGLVRQGKSKKRTTS